MKKGKEGTKMGSGVKGCMCVNGEQQKASSMACRMNDKEEINTLAAPLNVTDITLTVSI